MSQHDYDLANQAGAAFRADLNIVLAAIVSQNSGATAPSTTFAYQWWADTTTGLLKIRNAANSAWVTVGDLSLPNLGLRDANVVTVGGTANAITLTKVLPGTALAQGQISYFKATASNSGATTIADSGLAAKNVFFNGAACAGGEIISGESYLVYYDGTQYHLFSSGNSAQMLQLQTNTAFTTAGTSTAYTLTPVPALASYATGKPRYNVQFHAANGASPTMNISGLGVKNLKVYDSSGAKVTPAAGAFALNMIADVLYDGTDIVVLNQLPTTATRKIETISASVSSNALTLTLNPTTLDFRSSTLSSGTVNTRSVPSAISLTVASGATLGTANGVAARLAVLALDNAGTVELAVSNLNGGVNLDETTLISTTALSGSSNSASVIYSTTARTNVSFRVVGFIDITETTAGTWATAATTIQGYGGQACSGFAGIGYGQTWQTVTRTSGTTYYNTTGRPIIFCPMGPANVTISVTINGYSFQNIVSSNANTVVQPFIVSPGASYSHTTTGTVTVAELR